MNGLGDSLTIGILLTLIFGAVSFYLYSRLAQNEKRVALLENLLLTLKMSTEASLGGPDSVEPVSSPAPLQQEDVDVEEESYADLLKEIPVAQAVAPVEAVAETAVEAPLATLQEEEEEEQEDEATPTRSVDVNYEAMSVRELSALAKQRGITGVPQRKKELIDALKRQSVDAVELQGATIESGFQVDL